MMGQFISETDVAYIRTCVEALRRSGNRAMANNLEDIVRRITPAEHGIRHGTIRP